MTSTNFKKTLSIGLIMISLLVSSPIFSQDTIGPFQREIISEIQHKKIVALGDASHLDFTTTKLRVDLIKELVNKHDFKIIALESNYYEIYKAFEEFLLDDDLATMNKSLYRIMHSTEMDELFSFLAMQRKNGKDIKVVGFDSYFSGTNTFKYYFEKLTAHPNSNHCDFNTASFKKSFRAIITTNLKALLRTKKDYTTVRDSFLCYLQNTPKTIEDKIFTKSLLNTNELLNNRFREIKNNDNLRDSLMYSTIRELENLFPNDKMILFGSSTHLLKKPKAIFNDFMQNDRTTLGQLLTRHYGKEYYFLAYTAVSGYKNHYFGKTKLKAPIENTIEQFIHTTHPTDKNHFINSNSNYFHQAQYSRLLGHQFYRMNLSEVVDGLVVMQGNNELTTSN